MARTLLSPLHPHVIEFIYPSGLIGPVDGMNDWRCLITLLAPEVVALTADTQVQELVVDDNGIHLRLSAVFTTQHWAAVSRSMVQHCQATLAACIVERHGLGLVYYGIPRTFVPEVQYRFESETPLPLFDQYYPAELFTEWGYYMATDRITRLPVALTSNALLL